MTNKLTYITSRDNPRLVRLRKLAQHPGEYRKQGQVLLEGEHLCRAWALRSGAKATHILLSDSAWQDGGLIRLVDAAAETVIVADAVMAEVSTLETPAPVAFVVPLPTQAIVAPDAPSIVLDRIQDAGNVGSILRSAAAFGFAQVLALQGTASLWSSKVLRAGMGAHFGLRLIEGVREQALDRLAVPWLGTSPHATETLPDVVLSWPCAWIFGNEGEGIRASLALRCRSLVRIPQPGGEESLNVAAAAAVCLYESARRRG